ncbi:MAG TPA: alpha/beta hydrolase-fold protein, partial [Opitutaceae bacterium]|nr:alpha/beta hydrolase-fold protein [Opitutaceae bacterium]
HTISNSELRVLPRNAAGRQYQLHIGLPGSYAKDTTRHYPVVFVTDAYWDFEKMDAIRGALVYDRYSPEFIIVGLGYAGENLDYGSMRLWELSPVQLPAQFGGKGPDSSGHAAEFLQSLETEIIPLVDREYRTDPAHRVLAGASLGGLFTLYTMYSKPELFSAYLAATPSVVMGNDWLFGYEDAFAKTKRPLPVRLFVSGGGNESPGYLGGIKRFDQRIVSRQYAGLAHEFRIIEGERHAGMQLEAYTRGLQFIFAPLAPESGPSR